MQRKKLIAIAVIAATLVGVITVTSLTRPKDDAVSPDKTASITTIVAPTFGTDIRINGEKVEEGKVQLKPGRYDVVVSHKGFETQMRTVTIADGENATVAIALASNEPSTSQYYILDESEGRKLEEISGRQSGAGIDSQAEKLPLINRLPKIVAGHYRIDFGQSEKNPKDPTATRIIITYHEEEDKQNALNWIRYQGYDPAKLEITYQSTD